MDIKELLELNHEKKGALVSIVLPLYNEEESLPVVLEEMTTVLHKELPHYNFEITFIDDCSTDNSFEIVSNYVSRFQNIKISIAQLAANSGSHVAITAGLNICRGDFAIIMSSDGQDPVIVIKQLIEEWEKGHNLVLAARSDNLDQSPISKLFSRLAWKMMNWSTRIKMPEKGCDLLGMDRIVLNSFNKMNERNTTFIYRLLSLGFNAKEIEYTKRERIGGRSKWTFIKKISIMLDAITGFSNRPLQLITKLGLLSFFILFIRWVFVMYDIYILANDVSEYDIIVNVVYTGVALQVLILGVIGDYIWRILDETRKRPVYSFRAVQGNVFDSPKKTI